MKDAMISTYFEPMLIAKILKKVPSYFYSTHSHLFYEGQTPIVAYLVLEGQINLIRNRKIRQVIKPGELLGLYQLIDHNIIPFAAEALPKTKVVFLDRSTVKEILSDKDEELKKSFECILKSS